MVQIVFASSADILPDEAKALNAHVLPVDIIFGAEVFKDGVDLTFENFFDKMKAYTESTGKIPSTSQINTQVHVEAFKPMLEKGDEIFYISMSSGMSKTTERAHEAVKELNAEDKITVFDSEKIAIPYGMMVKEIIKARDKGLSRAELEEVAKDLRDRVELLCFVNDLTYVKKGGRLKGVQAIMATVLNIKPIISIRDANAVTVSKAIGTNGAYKKIAKIYSEYEVDKDMPIYVAYAGTPEVAEKIESQIKAVVPDFKSTGSYGIGSAIGTHTGPGCGGISFFRKKGTKSVIAK